MNRKLTGEERERYSRQIMLDQIGEEGQEKLGGSSVLVVGAGGLGSPVLYYLAAAGVGRLGIVDNDRVGLSNLQRQILHSTLSLGSPKVESAKDKLAALNPHLKLDTYRLRVTEENVAELISDYDLVVMAVDNYSTRYLLNEACFKAGKPLIEGAVDGFYGHTTSFIPPYGPCYQCLFPKKDGSERGNRSAPGVIGYVPGVIGAIQAGETLKLILGIGQPLLGRLLLYNSLQAEFQTIPFTRAEDCPVCKSKAI
jgi:molybdopterin/thiamine biosynthesis adenylyltransferase